MSSTTPSTSSNDYKCSANHVPNTWSEDMVTSDLRTETSISQLLENSPLLYTPTLSSTVTSPDLRDTLEADDDESRIPPTGIFTLQDLINIEELRKLAASNDCMFTRTSNNSTTLPNLAPSITSMKPIAPALFSPISAISSSSPTSEADPSERQSSTNNVSIEEKKKSAGGRKRKAESLEEKEQRQRERILRNRHAAQMSRDKKRRQMADLESQNTILKEENSHLSKRLKVVEEENANLSAKLDSISAQLAEIQSHLAVSEMNKVLLDGVRGSAVSAASEKESLDFSNLKEDPINNNSCPEDFLLLPPSLSNLSFPRESSEKSQQRPVKTRNLYGMSSITPTFPIWMCPPQMLKQLLLTFSIVFWTTTGQQKNFLLFSNNQMVFVDDIVISELLRRFEEKRWSKSVKAVRGCGASGLKRAPRDWRKYPP